MGLLEKPRGMALVRLRSEAMRSRATMTVRAFSEWSECTGKVPRLRRCVGRSVVRELFHGVRRLRSAAAPKRCSGELWV